MPSKVGLRDDELRCVSLGGGFLRFVGDHLLEIAQVDMRFRLGCRLPLDDTARSEQINSIPRRALRFLICLISSIIS